MIARATVVKTPRNVWKGNQQNALELQLPKNVRCKCKNKHESKRPLHYCGDIAEWYGSARDPSINRDDGGDGGETGRRDDSAYLLDIVADVTFFPAGSSLSKTSPGSSNIVFWGSASTVGP